MMYFFVIGPVSYSVAVFIRTLYFCSLLMFDATIITICLFRQIIILRVTKTINFIKIHTHDFFSPSGFAI